MPTTNKSANVANNSNYARNPLTLADIVKFSRKIADTIYKSDYYSFRENHVFEIEYGDYDAVVEYSVELKCDLVTEFMGDRLYEWQKVGESIEVLSVHHYDDTPHPAMCCALNQILR